MKILIELPTWLGDCVMATPAIENISNYYGKSTITIIGSKAAKEVLISHPKVVDFNVIDKNYISLYKTSKHLGRFDLYFSFRSSIRSSLFKFFVQSDKKYQFDKSKYKCRHQVEKYNDFVCDSIGKFFPAGPLVIHSNKLIENKNKKTLGIHPGASYGSAKRWYPKEFAIAASELSSKYDIKIYGGPEEIEISSEIEKNLQRLGVKNFKNLAGKTSISDLVTSISCLDLFLTGDSGPMHIAASFNIPTVAIFGPTNDTETSQWMNERNINVKKNLNCQPCMKRVCPLSHHNCMKLIKSKDVLMAVKSIELDSNVIN
jgi:heptosyltransferase-2